MLVKKWIKNFLPLCVHTNFSFSFNFISVYIHVHVCNRATHCIRKWCTHKPEWTLNIMLMLIYLIFFFFFLLTNTRNKMIILCKTTDSIFYLYFDTDAVPQPWSKSKWQKLTFVHTLLRGAHILLDTISCGVQNRTQLQRNWIPFTVSYSPLWCWPKVIYCKLFISHPCHCHRRLGNFFGWC